MLSTLDDTWGSGSPDGSNHPLNLVGSLPCDWWLTTEWVPRMPSGRIKFQDDCGDSRLGSDPVSDTQCAMLIVVEAAVKENDELNGHLVTVQA